MQVWDISSMGMYEKRAALQEEFVLILYLELVNTIDFDNGFTATLILHPATYLNKVLVASSQGTLQLWNIRTQWVFFCMLFVTSI